MHEHPFEEWKQEKFPLEPTQKTLSKSLILANKTTDFQLRLQSKALTATEIKLVFAETSKKKLSKMQDKN